MATKNVSAPSGESNAPAAAPKGWAPASPGGLVAVAAATSGLAALIGGLIVDPHGGPDGGPGPDPTGFALMGCWLLGGAVIQIITAVLELKSGELLGGNTFLYLGGFMMFTGGIEMIMMYHIMAGGGKPNALLDGVIWSALSLVLWTWTPAYVKPFSLLSVIFILLDVALPTFALANLGVAPGLMTKVSAVCFALVALVAVYFSAAIIVNSTQGKKIYPMP